MTQLWVLHPQAPEYVVMTSTSYKDPHGWADCIDRFIQIVKQLNQRHIVPTRGMVGLVHLVPENAASGRVDRIWLLNNHSDSDTNWIVS